MNTATSLIVSNFEQSIIELSKRKLQLLKEVDQINQDIMFLREQQEKCYEGDQC